MLQHCRICTHRKLPLLGGVLLNSPRLQVGGRTVLRFALAYGFRNIQTLLRRVRQGASPYDYVEVMACPSGCLNGGGQLPTRAAAHSPQQLISEVEAVYHQPQARYPASPLWIP